MALFRLSPRALLLLLIVTAAIALQPARAEDTAANLALVAVLGVAGQEAMADKHAGAMAAGAHGLLRVGQELVQRL